MPAAIPPDVQKKLYAETDARFAVQTGVTKKLDPHNKADQKLIPIWNQIYSTVLGEYYGPLGVAWSIDHPVVVTAIAEAHKSGTAATDHLGKSVAAMSAGDQAAAAEHSKAAGAHLTAGAQTTQAAAPHVPTSASPGFITQIAHDFSRMFGQLVASGEATPADAVTAMQVAAAPAHATEAAQGAPVSPALAPVPAPVPVPAPESAERPSGGPLPWKPLLAVTGLFGIGVALASRNAGSSAGRTYRMRRAR